MVRFPWYDVVEGSALEQGDFIAACRVLHPSLSADEGAAEVEVQLMVHEIGQFVQDCRGNNDGGMFQSPTIVANGIDDSQLISELGMRTDQGAQRIGQSKGEEEIGDGQEQASLLAQEPGRGVGLAAEREMAVVAGMVEVPELVVFRTFKELAAQGRSTAGEDLVQNLALTQGQGDASP